MKKGGYKNYCKSIREEWKKKGEKVPVPEQGKRLCVARPFKLAPSRPNSKLSLSCIFLTLRAPPLRPALRTQWRRLEGPLRGGEGQVHGLDATMALASGRHKRVAKLFRVARTAERGIWSDRGCWSARTRRARWLYGRSVFP